MNQKIMIIGAGGFLGLRLQKQYHANVTEAFTHAQLNITNLKEVEAAIGNSNAQVVINCAAISNTGYAQQHPDEAYAVNVTGAVHIAKACAKAGKKLLYMSSDQVYNGCTQQGPLKEDMALCPVSVYAAQKLQAEQAIQNMLPTAVGLRLTWLYDLPQSGLRVNSNLLNNLLQAQQTNTALSVATNEYRGVTWVQELVENMKKAALLPGGIYNMGSTGCNNTYKTALFAAEKLHLPHPAQLVLADKARYAQQPRNLLMDTTKAEQAGIVFSGTEAGIAKCVAYYNL